MLIVVKASVPKVMSANVYFINLHTRHLPLLETDQRRNMKTVNILGTDYEIRICKISENDNLKNNNWCGYCDQDDRIIVVADLDEDKYFEFDSEDAKDNLFKRTLRHEIIHAFLNESGLSDSAMQYQCAWSKNEEMVDWFAIQYPKIKAIFEELDIQ